MKISRHFVSAWCLFSLWVAMPASVGDMRLQPQVVGSDAVSVTFDCATDAYYQILAAGSLNSGAWAITNMGLGSLSPASWTGRLPQARLYLCVRAAPQRAPGDADGDGLDDVFELSHVGFNPLDSSDALRDTDGDGMPDGWEMMFGLLPANASDATNDSDADGLSNLQEFLFGTNPLTCDTDQDGLSDEEEIAAGLDPLSHPLQRRLTSLVLTYDDQDRLETVEAALSTIRLSYDAAGNLTNTACSNGE
jgi:YD repeat-containing protein